VREKGGQAGRHKGSKAAADIICNILYSVILYRRIMYPFTHDVYYLCFLCVPFYKTVLFLFLLICSLSCYSASLCPPTSWIAALPSRLCISCLGSVRPHDWPYSMHSTNTMYYGVLYRHQSMWYSIHIYLLGHPTNHYRDKRGKSGSPVYYGGNAHRKC